VREGTDYEARLHVWDRELVLPGIHESGDAHDHRFELTSHVLAGGLHHLEWRIEEDSAGPYEEWVFPHARLHDEQNRGAMERTGRRFRRQRVLPFYFKAGDSYVFPPGEVHQSHVAENLTAVTFVEKTKQREVQARVIAPVATPPVPAFGYSAEERDAMFERPWANAQPERATVRSILERARDGLRTVVDVYRDDEKDEG
jgi:hypothetical protein